MMMAPGHCSTAMQTSKITACDSQVHAMANLYATCSICRPSAKLSQIDANRLTVFEPKANIKIYVELTAASDQKRRDVSRSVPDHTARVSRIHTTKIRLVCGPSGGTVLWFNGRAASVSSCPWRLLHLLCSSGRRLMSSALCCSWKITSILARLASGQSACSK